MEDYEKRRDSMFSEGIMGFGATREAKLTFLVIGRDGGEVLGVSDFSGSGSKSPGEGDRIGSSATPFLLLRWIFLYLVLLSAGQAFYTLLFICIWMIFIYTIKSDLGAPSLIIDSGGWYSIFLEF